jgi:hypothetical protein
MKKRFKVYGIGYKERQNFGFMVKTQLQPLLKRGNFFKITFYLLIGRGTTYFKDKKTVMNTEGDLYGI